MPAGWLPIRHAVGKSAVVRPWLVPRADEPVGGGIGIIAIGIGTFDTRTFDTRTFNDAAP